MQGYGAVRSVYISIRITDVDEKENIYYYLCLNRRVYTKKQNCCLIATTF